MILSTFASAHSIAFCLIVIATTALAFEKPQKAADRLLSQRGGLIIEDIRKLVQEVERDEPSSELAQTVQGTNELSLANCNEHYYRGLIQKREQHLKHLPLARYFTDVMRRQRKWCQNYLDSELNRRVVQFPEVAQEYFNLFLSRDLVGLDFYHKPDNSITKLRQLTEEAQIDTQDQFEAQFGERFFGACRQINDLLDDLEPLKRDQESFASLPMSSNRYFRMNSFCKNLVKFDLLNTINEILFSDIKSRSTLIKFGRYLSAEDPINIQVASDAALDYATDYEFLLRKRPDSERMNPLNRRQRNIVMAVLSELRTVCDNTLEKLENLIWLLQFAGVGIEELILSQDESHHSRLHKYLKTVYACQQMPTLNIENLLHRHQEHLIATKSNEAGLIQRAVSFFIRPRTSPSN